jgi:LuxR family maltose regulon positive regulatory protein
LGSRESDVDWAAVLSRLTQGAVTPADAETPHAAAATRIDPLIKLTKLVPPRLPKSTVARKDLLKRLQTKEPPCLTLFQAPAGFGKTVTMVLWRNALIEAGYPVAWLNIDADDDDLSHFLLCLVASLRRGGCEISDGVFTSFRREDPDAAPGFLTALVNEMWQARQGLFLFVDDLHRTRSPAVAAFLLELAQHAPDNVHLVLGSSGRIALPFQYLRSRIEVIDSRALIFTFEEAHAFFDERLGFPLTPDDLRRLHDATQGWIVAMQLAISGIRSSPDPKQFIRRISAQAVDIAGYLVEDALTRLSREHLAFFVRTAFLEHLHPDLCAYVTGAVDSADLLQAFSEQAVFLLPDVGERQWYRFLPLFADYLRGKFELLPAAERANLHERAASWLGSREFYAQAVDHALQAGQVDAGVEWVAQGVRQLIREGKIVTTLALISRIPRERVERDRRLRMALAMVLSYSDQYREAECLLAEAEREDEARGVAPADEIHLIRARLAAYRDDSAATEAALRRCQGPVPPNDPIYAGLYCHAWSYVHLYAGRLEEARRAQVDMLRWSAESRGHYSIWLGRMVFGMSYAAEADLVRAAAAFQEVLSEAEEHSGRRSVPACMAAAGLAFLTYESGRRGEVLSILADRIDVIDATALPGLLVMANVCYARTLAAAGNADAGLERIRQLRQTGQRRGSARIEAAALAELVRWHLGSGAAGDADGALQDLLALGASHPPEQSSLGLQIQGFAELSLARCRLAAGDPARALQALAQQLAWCEASDHRHRWVQLMSLQAACLRALGREWLPALRAAWLVAERQGLCTCIADEGQPVLDLIAAVRSERLQRPLAVSETFVERLHAAATAAPQAPAPSLRAGRPPAAKTLLTDTEREVVALVAKGLANKQIANLMNIGLSTVKWHLHNISGKLDAPSRRIVADIARRKGLI